MPHVHVRSGAYGFICPGRGERDAAFRANKLASRVCRQRFDLQRPCAGQRHSKPNEEGVHKEDAACEQRDGLQLLLPSEVAVEEDVACAEQQQKGSDDVQVSGESHIVLRKT